MFLKLASFQSDVLIHVYVNFVRFNHKSKIIMFLKLISFQSSVLVHLPFSVHQFGQITKRPTTADLTSKKDFILGLHFCNKSGMAEVGGNGV